MKKDRITMKSTLVIFFLLILVSCNDAKKEGENTNSEASVELMEGYFPKNDMEFNQPVRVIITDKKEDFDRYFGVAKTMTNTVSEIDFDKNKVVAIVTEPSDRKQIIKISETKLKNNKLGINYKLEIGDSQSFSSQALKMFKVPKSIYAIDVYSDVEEESPKTED
ncbi:MAG: hypothetical protein ACTIJ9_06770 [Aequorivita sp.]